MGWNRGCVCEGEGVASGRDVFMTREWGLYKLTLGAVVIIWNIIDRIRISQKIALSSTRMVFIITLRHSVCLSVRNQQ